PLFPYTTLFRSLALTQILVETVTLVIFVLVLRRLPEHFTDRPLARTRYWRMVIAGGLAAVFGGFLLIASGARTELPVSVDFPEAAVDVGGGKNVAHGTLVVVRPWATSGAASLVLVA